ncbi:MAG: cupin domain-containing protein [Ignavibacteriales bacterium]|nr:cupin domain-containing protein [Ignavibacteriales bacterium]
MRLLKTSLGLSLPLMLSTVLLLLAGSTASAQLKDSKAKPLVVQLNGESVDYQKVLAGPPQTVSMESGLVVLAPAKSVGKHSTKSYEEAVIVFAGTGEMRITGAQTLKLKPNVVAYCPPLTEHDVVNTGSVPLRYLYIVAKPK